jgi:hypothetical protein
MVDTRAEPRVSARLVRACLRYLGERVGERALVAIAEERSPALGRLATSPPARGEWLPVADFVELVAAVEARAGDPATHRLLREMTRATMAAALSTVWGTHLADATPESMLERAGTLWSLSYDAGRLEVVERGGRRARLAVLGWADPPPEVSAVLAEACAVIVARMGVGVPRAVALRADGRVEIEVSWEAQ